MLKQAESYIFTQTNIEFPILILQNINLMAFPVRHKTIIRLSNRKLVAGPGFEPGTFRL